ncbi:MAG TPA: MmcQ/YjbR family DNA-binding protein [Gammaproteobacteria bacterium]|jgi:hypothetical protein
MNDFDALRQIGLALPDVVDAKTYGAPALKLRGKILACVPVNKSAETNCAMVHVGRERRAQLLQGYPETYYITEHYWRHPVVLVRLGEITRKDLQKLLRDAWRLMSMSSPGSRGKSPVRRAAGKPAARKTATRKKPRKA